MSDDEGLGHRSREPVDGRNGDDHPGTVDGHDGLEPENRDKAVQERERARSREDRDRREGRHKEKSSRRDRDERDYRRKDRSRSRSRDRRRKSRSRERRHRRRSRSSDRDRHRHRRSSSRSRPRDSRDPRRGSRSRSRSVDGVGGYHPRKRQEPAKPTASMFATNDPFAHLRSKTPADPADAMRIWQEQMLKSRQLVLACQAKSAVQQANKAQRELYIGNLTPGVVTDVMLRQVFDSALIASFPQAAAPGQEPVVKVSIHSDGRYGFIEFRTPEYASAALLLNGQINLMSQSLSIGRPASYVDPNRVNQAAVQAEAALAAFQQGAGGGMASIAAAAALVPGSAGAHMAAAGNLAAAGHNAAAAAAGSLPAGMAGVPGVGGVSFPGVAFPGPPGMGLVLGVAPAVDAAALVGEAGSSSTPTPFVCVTGMITPAVLEDDGEYEEVMIDLQEECSKHGQVYEVKVPRPADPKAARQLFGTSNYGKAYVQFVDVSAAQKAKDAIHGRMFAGNMVTASFLTAQAYGIVLAAMAEQSQQ